MQYRISYLLLVAACAVLLSAGCENKRNADKPKGRSAKDSLTVTKDSTGAAKDSASTGNDSTSASNDSLAAKRDSLRIADSLAAHPPPTLSYEQHQGQYVYSKYCAVCHGAEGKADGFNTYNLDPKPRDLTEQHYLSEFSDDRLIQIIRDGGRGTNKSPSMPPYGWTLGKDDIAYVAAYVRTFMPADSAKKQ
ncbi:MAG: cytochrome c [Bacteroidota bacterium]|nr:cytochrome c [Bacteroidota bacterium]MDP4229637.1 cytochrome c [Bacteroidota bacterium]MDP4234907.1 cytochrome c [Bacteroidota bacterium]